MEYLCIRSHPYDGSFNVGVEKTMKEVVLAKGHRFDVIDLVNDNFNPVMSSEDLKQWNQGKGDALVKKYQAKIDKADILIFPFPIWWGSMPAVLKGFCDKVLLPDWAYINGEKGEMIGKLTNKKAIVITTMETPIEVYNEYYNNPVEGEFIKDTLQTCGIEVIKFFQIDHIVSGGRNYTEAKMEEIKTFIV